MPDDNTDSKLKATIVNGASATVEKQSEAVSQKPPPAIGAHQSPDPTRYGDWEKNGRCIDF